MTKICVPTQFVCALFPLSLRQFKKMTALKTSVNSMHLLWSASKPPNHQVFSKLESTMILLPSHCSKSYCV